MRTRIRNIVGPVFHGTVFVHHVYAMVYSNTVTDGMRDFKISDVDPRILDMKDFALLFFTSWNILLQTIYFGMATFYDALHITSKMPKIQDKLQLWKGYLFTSLVFPCSLFVSAMFWSVYSINREWVLPEILDEYVPEWLNHSLHTNITVFLIIEVLIANQLLPTFKSAFWGLSILTLIYDSLFFITYFLCGRWIYGLFHVLGWHERIFLMLFNYFFVIIVMKIGITIENFKYSFSRNNKPVRFGE